MTGNTRSPPAHLHAPRELQGANRGPGHTQRRTAYRQQPELAGPQAAGSVQRICCHTCHTVLSHFATIKSWQGAGPAAIQDTYRQAAAQVDQGHLRELMAYTDLGTHRQLPPAATAAAGASGIVCTIPLPCCCVHCNRKSCVHCAACCCSGCRQQVYVPTHPAQHAAGTKFAQEGSQTAHGRGLGKTAQWLPGGARPHTTHPDKPLLLLLLLLQCGRWIPRTNAGLRTARCSGHEESRQNRPGRWHTYKGLARKL